MAYRSSTTDGKWGFTIRDTDNGEWEFAVFTSGRQDGQTAYSVLFINVDSDVYTVHGMAQWEKTIPAIIVAAEEVLKKGGYAIRPDFVKYLRKRLETWPATRP